MKGEDPDADDDEEELSDSDVQEVRGGKVR
jgi:hypothetical protein